MQQQLELENIRLASLHEESQNNTSDRGYNIGPTKHAPVFRIHHDNEGAEEQPDSDRSTDTPSIEYMTWGLIPFWTKELKTSDHFRTFNARKESILDGAKLWKSVRGEHFRCVVPIQGYYEWLHKTSDTTKKVDKIPYYIKRKDNQLMYLAGMCSSANLENGSTVLSYTIVTGPAPKDLEWLHARMPIVMRPGSNEWNRWLGNEKWTDEFGTTCLKAYEHCKQDLEWYEVTRDVGNVKNDGEYLTQEIKKNDISLFFKSGKDTVKSEKPKSTAEKSSSKKARDITSLFAKKNSAKEDEEPSLKREASETIEDRIKKEVKKPKRS
ncbi:CYFA0S05e04632g1_1 [Cyberlindnera fabianii]|uniref:CYFA0S05e04632g1_1 n=1 Tax=Cyberlindnera fabianii TaxID=36022 RepID=A0A061B1A9_CYBFA|nr:CYFA0S05e04632g1_1 [Cyberlindnera fabianii]